MTLIVDWRCPDGAVWRKQPARACAERSRSKGKTLLVSPPLGAVICDSHSGMLHQSLTPRPVIKQHGTGTAGSVAARDRPARVQKTERDDLYSEPCASHRNADPGWRA